MLRVRENSTLGKAKHTGVCHFGCVSICEQGDSPLSKKMAFGGGVAVYEKITSSWSIACTR